MASQSRREGGRAGGDGGRGEGAVEGGGGGAFNVFPGPLLRASY